MRKIVFTIVGSMLISLCAVQAQQQTDTTGTASKSKSKQNKYQTEQRSKDRNKANKDQAWQQQSDRMRGDQAVVIIDAQEIPSNIRQKLDADEKYSGWEKATVYHNTKTGDYVFIPQPFRLDKEGNEQEMRDDQAWGYRNGQQGRDMSQQDQDMSAQEQAQNQMGEIPTSASEDQTDDQQQSNSYRTEQDQQAEQQQQQNSQSYRPDNDQYNTANMIEVQEDQIPESLRTTLQENEFDGWKENGKLYRNPSTSEYVLIIDSNSSRERRFRFDANGERVNE